MIKDKTRRTVRLHPEHWAAVEAKAAEIGSPGNTSAGLRALIAHYQRLMEEKEGTDGHSARTD